MTSRGFPAPTNLLELRSHNQERLLVVRLTDWEISHLRLGDGITGKFVLLGSHDGAYDLVRVTP